GKECVYRTIVPRYIYKNSNAFRILENSAARYGKRMARYSSRHGGEVGAYHAVLGYPGIR
ncbi:MAG: hypothetical protein WB470_06510, partial [Candidatus Acidiferrales bacterium]